MHSRRCKTGIQTLMKKDITERNDIEILINCFYEKVKANEIIGFIFNDVANVDWEKHLPRMYSFWASLLLGENSFTGNPMIKHIALNKLTRLTNHEFSEWLRLFNQTTDELFKGEKAEEAKLKASNIARLMLYKIEAQ